MSISEAAVRKYLAEGKLARVVLPDGTIDAEKADQLLESPISRKARRLRAQVRNPNDDVSELSRSLVIPEDAGRTVVSRGASPDSYFAWPQEPAGCSGEARTGRPAGAARGEQLMTAAKERLRSWT